MALFDRFHREVVRVSRLAAIGLVIPLALLPACDRSADKADEHASEPHSHAAGQEHGAASPPQSPVATYVCPMHPEVQQPVPGKCPKCGMDLVPRSAAIGVRRL